MLGRVLPSIPSGRIGEGRIPRLRPPFGPQDVRSGERTRGPADVAARAARRPWRPMFPPTGAATASPGARSSNARARRTEARPLVDDFFEEGDELLVRRDDPNERVAVSNRRSAGASTASRPPRITPRPVTPGGFGSRIVFPLGRAGRPRFGRNFIAEEPDRARAPRSDASLAPSPALRWRSFDVAFHSRRREHTPTRMQPRRFQAAERAVAHQSSFAARKARWSGA